MPVAASPAPRNNTRLLSKFSAGHAQRREQARERHRGRALNVIVEDIYLVAIFVQQPERRVIGEIFELNQHPGEGLARSNDEFVHEFVVSRASQAFLPQADIIAIIEKILVVGADVQHDRQTVLRVDPGAGRIERKFADRDAHAVRAEVAEAKDALSVGDNDKLGRIRPVSQQFRNTSAIIGANEHAAWPLEDQAEPLAGEAYRWGVD